METSRRQFVAQTSAAFSGLTLVNAPFLAHAFPSRKGEEVVPWLDPPPENPDPAGVRHLLRWEELDSWVTPNDKFFAVNHYNWPVIDAQGRTLGVEGLVGRPLNLTLGDLQARPRREVTFTLECSGNHGFPWFIGGIGTARWAGTPLAPILEEAQMSGEGREVAFFGTDEGEEEVRDIKMKQNFARSMSLADAMSPDNLLCYKMNGEPLPQDHGFPVRLIAPGWFGIANVKWLKRIEVRPSRLMTRFMARDYVTIREEPQDGETAWVESSVGRALLKSVPAKVTRSDG
jgi:DMSO/TMAO reductase YedYZ molybdopterin-dependent catalytic subunit